MKKIIKKTQVKPQKKIGVLSLQGTKAFSLKSSYDYGLLFAIIVLTCIGAIVCVSAIRIFDSHEAMAKNQIISIILGICATIVISVVDYDYFKILGFGLYGLGIGLLALVPFIGVEMGGAKSWIRVPLFGTFQPSEIAKTGTILVTAIFFARIKEKQGKAWLNWALLALFALVPMGFTVLQNDMGTAIIYAFAFAIMLFVCGVKFKYIFMAAGTFAISLPFVWFNILKDHQKGRILAVLQTQEFADSYAYNIVRAQRAISSGGLMGKGLFKGDLTGAGYVPVQESDFIFSVVGEELGFLGCITLLALIFGILFWMLWISRCARDTYGSFIALGITALFTFQYIENIGGCIGLVPVTGIPLPFVSQGGTAMIANFMALGVVLSVSARRNRIIDVVDRTSKRSYREISDDERANY